MSGPVHSFPDEALGNFAHLLDVGDGLAAAIDPPRDADRILEDADRAGLRVAWTLDTHLHADFVGAGRELAEAVGAEPIAPAEGGIRFGHRGVREPDVLRLGSLEVEVLSTPGHTPEHVSYLARLPGGAAVFTGGSLIAGGAARTDLISPEQTEPLARAQYRSLRRLASLPDDTAVYPTHGGGSFCSAAPSSSTARTTVGAQRLGNPLLQVDDEDRFVKMLLDGYGSYPSYFLRLREVNRLGPPLTRELPGPRPLDPHEAEAAIGRGAWLVDARPTAEWAQAHPHGAVAIELRPAFASWLGWLVPFGAPVVLVLDEARVADAVRLARRIGYDRILGWLDGGVEAWREAGLPVSEVELVDVREAAARRDRGVAILDVRQAGEHQAERIPGTVNVELADLAAARVPQADEMVVHCGHGERAATAASLLERRGVRAASLRGGIAEWEAAGLPVER